MSKEQDQQYVIEVYVRSHPDNFRGPLWFREFVSSTTEYLNARIGHPSVGMSKEKALELAEPHSDKIFESNNRQMLATAVVKPVSFGKRKWGLIK